ncbi:DHHC palmitoyltransferase-domain-containing protein [Multifurca ochricompacta]|uniref:Palmitoyltransferase PFA4 n=1 Tax=Multifurca ochricompacta TaxID=376703 RepID=A0AAD4QLZ3_9AGAM|nr:DHHC palmitoyltransferase-domain-containing protein [Multifurca ochricompacta]
MGRLLGRLVVAFTTGLICFISYTPQIFIIWPWYGRELSVELLTLLVPFNILVGILLYNYYLCVTTDPGGVPHGWEPEFDDAEGYEVKKMTGNPRYCRMCRRYKPPRAHHCKTCRRCAIANYHHCPWVNNCVGFYNYGHFIRFLFFVDLACIFHVTMITRRIFDTLGKHYWDSSDTTELLFVVLNYVTCVPVLLMVGGFSLYHLYCILGNTTTIEGWEKDKVATLIRRGKIREIKFPYNLGARRNVDSMLGTNPLLWCWPNVGPLGTGTKYQLAEGDGKWVELSARDPQEPEFHEYSYAYAHGEWMRPASPWTYDNDGPNPVLIPSNSRSTQQLRARKPTGGRRVGVSSVPPYHPDYEPVEDGDEWGGNVNVDGDVDGDDDDGGADGVHFAAYESGMARVRRGSEGYEVLPIDRERLLAEHISTRGREAGHYHRYVPDPPSEPDSESGREADDDDDDDDDEPLAARVEKWRSGEAIS